MPHLSKPQAVVLGMWSFAIAMTHHCGLSTAVVFLGEILEQPENTIRERLRQWYNSKVDKNGRKRREIQVEQSFVPLLRAYIKLVVIRGKKFSISCGCFHIRSAFYFISY
ncbi:MAG: hypothetical protein F6K63_25295 [Moorea sp. SIO1G6]|uniref:hypothetical protein n=1 Tax=unclassified Moorena TaxID=2683338 RepID=UPI0013BACCCE|nr:MULTISPECIES: hypothetical protein [unclassified Moorena]NEQ11825.1 hypothetical protein [Moorena sp. SIO4E2]NET67516.1 hypothetical protein [Moorena sp. SIO1G6]